MLPEFDIEANEIHGVYGKEVDESFARMLGQAVGTRLAGGRLVVGGDARPSTPALRVSFIAGVLSTGCDVYDVDVVPTPALSFAQDRLWADGAVMVTGSHRPTRENGFNITLGRLPSPDIDLAELQQVLKNRGPFASAAGELRRHDILHPYESFLVARFVPESPLTIVLDGNNGSMGETALRTLRDLDYEVIEHNCSPGAGGDDRTPDPFLPEHLVSLSRTVLLAQAQLGVAFDGDGDEVVFANEQGTILTPGQTLVLFARVLLLYQPGSEIVYDDSFEPFVAEEILKVGGKPIPLRASPTEIKRKLLERGAVLGADTRGHYFFRAMGGDDSLYATLVMLRVLGRYDSALEPILDDL